MTDQQEPRDDALGRALSDHLDAEGAARRSQVKLDALRGSIVSAAAFRLASLRRAPAWWEVAGGWARAAVPLGIAAGIVAVMVAAYGPVPDQGYSADTTADIAAAATSSDSLTTPMTRERLLLGAFSQ